MGFQSSSIDIVGLLLVSLLLCLNCICTIACPFATEGVENPHKNGGEGSSYGSVSMEHRFLQADGTSTFTGPVSQAVAFAGNDIINILRRNENMGPKFVRLTFHDCVGGKCDGCVNMGNPDNAGLDIPINLLKPIAAAYANRLTRADVWALAGITSLNFLGATPSLPFQFYGRETCNNALVGDTSIVMPGAHMTTAELLAFFQKNFGFNSDETVAIMGVHTL